MFERLKNFLRERSSDGIALAFSGGVDSTLLLAVLKILADEKSFPLMAFTVHSVFQSEDELLESKRAAEKFGIEHVIFKNNPLEIPQVKANSRERCYFCKKTIFAEMKKFALSRNIKTFIDGTNADDLNVFRPGRRALRELGIISPLAEIGISKKEIRELAGTLGLECASKPSRPCFATRFEYDVFLTPERISQVEKGEKILSELLGGNADFRLRVNGDVARIEVNPEDFFKIISSRERLLNYLKSLGFRHVALDLYGFCSGSMDEHN